MASHLTSRTKYHDDLEFDSVDFFEETDSDLELDPPGSRLTRQPISLQQVRKSQLAELHKPQLAELRKPQLAEFRKPQLVTRSGEDRGSVNIPVDLLKDLKDLDVTLKDIDNRIFDIDFKTRIKFIDDALSVRAFRQLGQFTKRFFLQPRETTIGFVEAIERANQFFDFMQYLKKKKGLIKHDSDTLQVFKRLVKQERVQDSYKKLHFQDIMNAISEHKVFLMLGKDFQLIKKGNTLTDLEVLALEGTLKEIILYRLENFGTRSKNPITDLVYRIRYRAYVMHEDPLVELERTMEGHPGYHTNDFRARLLHKSSEKKVKIRGIPLEYDVDKVKALLSSCGSIEDFKMTECGYLSNDAYVTFSSAEEAKLAPFLCEDFDFSPYPESQSEPSKTFKEFKKAKKVYNKFRNLP